MYSASTGTSSECGSELAFCIMDARYVVSSRWSASFDVQTGSTHALVDRTVPTSVMG